VPFPSDDQKNVIDHRGRPLVVVAGPGTGKTKTLVERMISLLHEDPNRDISFVTFTRTSRSDTSQKIASAFPTNTLEDDVQAFPRLGTMHASARAILHRLAGAIGLDPNFNILIAEKGERSLIVSEVIDDLGVAFSIPSIEKAIVYMLCNLTEVETDAIASEMQVQLLERYLELIRFYRSCGMEEIVYLACGALQESQHRIPPVFIQVDEYQDLNPTDQYFVNLIASDVASQVVVVGDDAQSIYQFRHANYEGLRVLWESEEWEHIRFNDSFRLPAHIQRAALSLIEGEGYLGSVMNVKPSSGQLIRTFQCTKSEYQPIVISRSIRDFLQQATKGNGEPVTYSDVMILCPSYNLTPRVRDVLEDNGIPSKEPSKSRIPDDVWRIILIIRMAFHGDNIAFRQWLDIAGLDLNVISSARLEAMESGISLMEFCRHLDNDVVRRILDCVALVTISYGDASNFIEAIAQFPYLAVDRGIIENAIATVLHDGELPASSQILRNLYSSYGVLEDEGEAAEDDAVMISTLHSSKGLEAELVCLMWMNERFMPMTSRDPQDERRLLYVAMTRAKQDLIISFHEVYDRQKGYLRFQAMSPFLREIADHLIIERIKASDLN